MAQPSSFATLIVASLLACCPRDDLQTKGSSYFPDGNDGGVDEEQNLIESMLRSASFALTVAFSVASNLPSSSPSLTSELASPLIESSEEGPPSLDLTRFHEVIAEIKEGESLCQSHAKDGAEREPCEENIAPVVNAEDKANKGYDHNEYPSVDGHEVKQIWMRWGRLPGASKHMNTLHLPSLDAIPEMGHEVGQMWMRRARLTGVRKPMNTLHHPPLGAVPEVMACDSLASFSSISDCSSISTQSTSSFLSLTSTKKNRKHVSSRHNAEWTIFE